MTTTTANSHPPAMTTMAAQRGCPRWLFPSILAITLLQNAPSIYSMFAATGVVLYRYDGPLFVKVLKDLLYLLLLFLTIRKAARHQRLPLTPISASLVILVAGMALMSWTEGGLLTGLVGLRWCLPLIVFMTMKEWSRDIDFSAGVYWIVLGLRLCLGLQLIQLFFMTPIFGELLPGVAARTPGIFIAPNTTAFFAATAAAFCMVLTPTDRRLNTKVLGMAFMTAILTQSGTGLVAVSVLALHFAFASQRRLFWLVTIGAIVVVFPNLNLLTMRKDYVELSGGGRIDALINIASHAWLSLGNFGLYTNTANLLSNSPELQVAPDSLIASWIGNFGVMTLVATLLLAGFVALNMRRIDWNRAMPCVLVLGIFSLTTVVFEAFPMNLYLSLGIWAARKPSRPSEPDNQLQ